MYFLYGPEAHQRGQAEQALIDLHLDPATSDFNLDRVSGRGVDPEALASMLATPPMMADWRVVVVRQAEALSQSPRLRGIVEAAVASPPPGLALVLVADLPSGSKAKIWKRKPMPAELKTTKPDVDNALKAILDAATKAGVWRDDAQVASVVVEKWICSGDGRPRVELTISDVWSPR